MFVACECLNCNYQHTDACRYHVKFAPPKSMELDANGVPVKESMKDDATGEPLMQRSDDTASALKVCARACACTCVRPRVCVRP